MKANTRNALIVVGAVGAVAVAVYLLWPRLTTAALYAPQTCPTGSYSCSENLAPYDGGMIGGTRCY